MLKSTDYKIEKEIALGNIAVFNKVDLGQGRIVWVGVFKGIVFVNNDPTKLQLFLDVLGSNEQVPECDPISLQEFKKLVETNEILKTVKNWKEVGVPI